ncbi:hypothetical protein A9P82_13715 [Arachidicoccus ginsenosidimutans]|uniref:LiaF transmembrane domain-containing protein n=1 Tax=Arachidicoccus sp. BS20 TaxID=1850526 RepID=UPI0007F07B30|nr:hypothetical protein [Arachidicoccus sp. BS20]ANI90255.1 hypothetical protein A9P82_13715 [Arachidicoccus sp. BS20]
MENEDLKVSPSDASSDNRFNNFPQRSPHNHWFGGVVIIIVGIVLLFNRMPQTAKYFPDWLFDWPMIPIVLGIFAGAKHGFRGSFGWLIPVFIGLYFLLQDQNVIKEQWNIYALPLLLILAGLLILLKRGNPRYGPYCRRDSRFYERMKRRQEFWQSTGRERFGGHQQFTDRSSEDYVDINSIFGSAEKTLFTKTFKGGNITCSFGGGELNLSQADIEETAILNVTVTFGGAEITVPANWTIQNELTAFMGGIEDKRKLSSPAVPPKILILRGSVFCGGVEIKNY